jgi:hypothetical protein
MKLKKKRMLGLVFASFLVGILLQMSIGVFADTKLTGMTIPANLPDPSTTRKITFQQIKGGSGTLDTEGLLDGTGSLTQGWTADSTATPATYKISKIMLNAGQTSPLSDGSNYTLITIPAATVTTASGQAVFELGSPNSHIAALADFYTDHFNGSNEPGGPDAKASPDGFYLIEETSSGGDHEPYKGIVSIPYMQEDASGASNDALMIYDLHLYPKTIKNVDFGIETYVNIIAAESGAAGGIIASRFPSRATTPGEFDYSHWQTDSVMNGSTNYWSIAMNVSNKIIGHFNQSGAPTGWLMAFGWGTNINQSALNSGENATDHFVMQTPTVTDSAIAHQRSTGNTETGVIFTDLNTGEREYFHLGFVSNASQAAPTYGGKNFTCVYIADQNHVTGIPDTSSFYGLTIQTSHIPSVQAFFGKNNPFGGNYAG